MIAIKGNRIKLSSPWLSCLLALTLWNLAADGAIADSRVIVMGVQSLDGDDEIARELDDALRENARLKLERLSYVGRGAATAAARRRRSELEHAARARLLHARQSFELRRRGAR